MLDNSDGKNIILTILLWFLSLPIIVKCNQIINPFQHSPILTLRNFHEVYEFVGDTMEIKGAMFLIDFSQFPFILTLFFFIFTLSNPFGFHIQFLFNFVLVM